MILTSGCFGVSSSQESVQNIFAQMSVRLTFILASYYFCAKNLMKISFQNLERLICLIFIRFSLSHLSRSAFPFFPLNQKIKNLQLILQIIINHRYIDNPLTNSPIRHNMSIISKYPYIYYTIIYLYITIYYTLIWVHLTTTMLDWKW